MRRQKKKVGESRDDLRDVTVEKNMADAVESSHHVGWRDT